MLRIGLQRAWSWYQSQLAAKPVRTQVVTSACLWASGDAVAQRVDWVAGEKRRRRQAEEGLDAGGTERLTPVAGRAHYEVGNSPLPCPRDGGATVAEGPEGSHSSPEGRKAAAAVRHLDISRICTTGLFGAAFVGPVGHYWYSWLEHFVKASLHLRPRSTPFIVTKIALDTFIFGPVHLVAFFTWTGLVSGHSLTRIRRDVSRDFLPAFLTEATVWPLIQFGNFRYVPVRHQLLFVNVFCLLDSAWLSWLKYEQDAPWKKTLSTIMSWPIK